MKTFRVLLLVVLMLGLLTGPTARAAHETGTCEGAWAGTSIKTCKFFVRGVPTSIKATASGGSMHIWVDVQIYDDPNPTLDVYSPAIQPLDCTAPSGSSCTRAADIGSLIDSTKQLYLVDCRIQGSSSSASGTYFCQSATGF